MYKLFLVVAVVVAIAVGCSSSGKFVAMDQNKVISGKDFKKDIQHCESYINSVTIPFSVIVDDPYYVSYYDNRTREFSDCMFYRGYKNPWF